MESADALYRYCLGEGPTFGYAFGFSVDEEINNGVYNTDTDMVLVDTDTVFVVEVRSRFVVKGIDGRTTYVGSERFGVFSSEEYVLPQLAERLRDYWLSEPKISYLIRMALLLAKKGGGPTRPTVVHLQISTIQWEGEPMDAAVGRAMRPDHLTPLDLRRRKLPLRSWRSWERYDFLREGLLKSSVRIDEGPKLNDFLRRIEGPKPPYNLLGSSWWLWKSSACRWLWDRWNSSSACRWLWQRWCSFPWKSWMSVRFRTDRHVCGVCGGQPFVGSTISRLRCGHVFHYHCVVRRLLDLAVDMDGEDKLGCIICGRELYAGPDPSRDMLLLDLF